MKKIARRFAVVGLSMSISLAYAAAPVECDGLKFATGPAGKGYSKMYANIVKVCGGDVHTCEGNTSGGLDNLNSLSIKEADVAIAALDTLTTMKVGDENVAGLQAVIGLNYNYLHVVTSATGFSIAGEKKLMGMMKGDAKTVMIQRYSDLKGYRIAVVGSAQLLARQLDRQMNYGMSFVDVDTDAAAFKMVRSGQVAAALSVSGWPSGTILPLKQDSGLTLVPFDGPTSAPYLVRPFNYKGLGVYNNNALAVPNMLVTRPFKGEKAQDVAKLKACIVSKLNTLQEGSFEPGWNEIKNLENTYDWPKFIVAGAAASATKSKKK